MNISPRVVIRIAGTLVDVVSAATSVARRNVIVLVEERLALVFGDRHLRFLFGVRDDGTLRVVLTPLPPTVEALAAEFPGAVTASIAGWDEESPVGIEHALLVLALAGDEAGLN